MAAACGAVFPVLVSVLLLTAVKGFQSEELECAYIEKLKVAEPDSGLALEQQLRGEVRENGTVRCMRGSTCYGLWSKTADGELHPVLQGCWTHVEMCESHRCLITATPSQIQDGSLKFCCCNRDLCNANFTQAPPTADTPAREAIKTSGWDSGQTGNPLKQVLIALVTVAIAAIVIVALFLGYRVMRGKQRLSLSALDVMEAAHSDSAVDLDDLKLLELIGRGRYGTVYRGSLSERCVAVKLFSSANRQNFTNERSIYALPLLQQHDNIARFLSAEERVTADGRPEFLILMELYPHGCLSQYLSVHTVDWTTCCRMTHGVTRGLAFLHTELYRGDQYKPPVAHRDVTSRNVLVRADLSCVLADFGLSMRLTGSRPCRHGDDDTLAISEVGTVRYMAPEVLGGALNLRDCEAALKQVDVYALGLLYWESFRRCSTLFPGEAVPEYQLAFQAELGNHPSLEEVQVLVGREKHRPRFPEAWKENSLALRSLKETMEDCWDQDAEARLTAQCAEERLAELTLLSTHTLTHNQRNLSQSSWPSHIGSSSCSYIEDLQVGVVKNLQGDGQSALVIKTTGGGSEGFEKNRNSINYERQQAQSQSRSSNQDSRVSASALTPSVLLCSISESEHTGGALPSVPGCLHLTEEDFEATKLDPKEVDKNLRETSDENLMEHSQKQFGSAEHQTSSLLYHQMLQTTEVTPQRELVGVSQMDPPTSSFVHPLPKQQNLPQRPTSLHILPKSKETTSASSRMKLAKLKSNHRQVETGVAKMNTVAVASSVEPQKVTTVTNNTNTRASVMAGNRLMVATTSCSAGVPTLVTNGAIGGGRTNPAGPQQEEEDKVEGEVIIGDDNHMNLLNSSPDEHEPLLRREQPPAESHPPHHQQGRGGNILTGRGSNSNNNNNRITFRADAKTQGAGVKAEEIPGPESTESRPISRADPEPHQQVGRCPPTVNMESKVQLPGPAEVILGCQGPASSLEESSGLSVPEGQGQDRDQTGSPSYSRAEEVLAPDTQDLKAQSSDPGALVLNSKVSPPEIQDPQNPALESHPVDPQDPETTALSGAVQRTYAGLQSAVLLRNQSGAAKTKRPERPCSLDLSTASMSTDDPSLTDDGALSASGEKIKRRVKTPYTLKKWRPASWVIPTDTTFDPDFEFSTNSSSSAQTHFSSDPLRAGSFGVPKINQSKSSMAVFLVGGGATATTTSEPDGLTCF